MKVRYYYNPVVKNLPDGWYGIDIYMDKKGKGIYLGSTVNSEWDTTLMNTHCVIDFLTDHYSSIPFLGWKRKLKHIKNVVYRFV